MAYRMTHRLRALALVLVGLGAGIGLDRLWLAVTKPPAVALSGAPVPPALTRAEPVRDYSRADAGTVLNLALTDWFTDPRRRPKALALLNDAPSEPPGSPRPPLRAVVIDARATPKGYAPQLPGTPVLLADCGNRPPLQKGELGIWVRRFEPRTDGTVEAEFVESNYGYTSDAFVYRAKRAAGRWRVEFIRSDLSD